MLRLDEGGALGELARSLWEKRQLPPSWLDERTPHEVLFLFGGGRGGGEGAEFDRVAELRRINAKRAAAGQMPVVPGWLMPEVPRR
ncbi:MAG TPA: hypothetical protein VGE74_26980 [Gemmata sp.]